MPHWALKQYYSLPDYSLLATVSRFCVRIPLVEGEVRKRVAVMGFWKRMLDRFNAMARAAVGGLGHCGRT